MTNAELALAVLTAAQKVSTAALYAEAATGKMAIASLLEDSEGDTMLLRWAISRQGAHHTRALRLEADTLAREGGTLTRVALTGVAA